MTGSRLFSPRWLAAGGAAVLAAVLGVALVLQNSGSACAAPPSTTAKNAPLFTTAKNAPPSTTAKKGKATYFALDGTIGNCSFPSPPADDLFVALGQSNEYAKGAACGTYIDVTGPKGKTRVKVIDSCPECPAGHLDLSLTAFKKIGVQSAGIIPITYKTVPGATVPGPISVRVKEGSSQYWLSVLIDNHANRLASVKIAGKGGSFRSATHEDFNYWTVSGGTGSGPFKVKITDVYGNSVTVPDIKLAPGRTQKTGSKLVKRPSSSAAVKKSVKKVATPKAPASSKPATSAPPILESTTPAQATTTEAAPPPAADLAANTADRCP